MTRATFAAFVLFVIPTALGGMIEDGTLPAGVPARAYASTSSTSGVGAAVDTAVVVVDVPNDASDALANALIGLGAAASCPGECLEWRDDSGRLIRFVFHP